MRTRYLKPTPELIEEYRAQGKYQSLESDITSLKLANGNKNATRLVRSPRTQKLEIEAPWLLADLFSF